jgi:hypothetical protein
MKRLFYVILLVVAQTHILNCQDLPNGLLSPPGEFSVMPFWFWNDELNENEIIRQISDFDAHGVSGFVIHPRIGLPDSIKWMSPRLISLMRIAIKEASKRKMLVILYDEGMYPSGSSSGQVVERNPAHAARGLAKVDLKQGEELQMPAGAKLITVIDRSNGSRAAIIERPTGGNIRGLHYIGEGSGKPREETPPAGDILNPEAVSSFIELVYDRYANEFREYFGNTIMGIFTDEPDPLGRGAMRGMHPGNEKLLTQINSILGYDFKPFLGDLWFTDGKDYLKHRSDYDRAINICLEENYYKRLSKWCSQHGIYLMGHPAKSTDIGTEKYFQVPGQDLVWRYVEPGPKALEGQHSTMAKCASSAMVHLGYRRNSNELYGAYGHNLTWDEMVWLANWCFVRGQNLLIPHAFYYSVRGIRFDERPPDVGPNAKWWPDYKSYADGARRLSWINTDSRQICNVAILCDATYLPDKAAKSCLNNQIDFNYLENRLLNSKAEINSDGIHISGMIYNALILDSLITLQEELVPLLEKLAKTKRLIINASSPFAARFQGAIFYNSEKELLSSIERSAKPGIKLSPASQDIRYRHAIKEGYHYYLLFNEGNSNVSTGINIPIKKTDVWFDPYTSAAKGAIQGEKLVFRPYELKVLISKSK